MRIPRSWSGNSCCEISHNLAQASRLCRYFESRGASVPLAPKAAIQFINAQAGRLRRFFYKFDRGTSGTLAPKSLFDSIEDWRQTRTKVRAKYSCLHQYPFLISIEFLISNLAQASRLCRSCLLMSQASRLRHSQS